MCGLDTFSVIGLSVEGKDLGKSVCAYKVFSVYIPVENWTIMRVEGNGPS